MRTRWKQTACGILSGMLLLSGLAVPAWAEDATDPVTNEGDWVVDDITLDMQDDGTAWAFSLPHRSMFRQKWTA